MRGMCGYNFLKPRLQKPMATTDSKKPKKSKILKPSAAKSFPEMFRQWQGGEPGFRAWLSDIQPRILHRSGRYEPFVPTPDQDDLINSALAVDDSGNFVHSISVNLQPRRHGKSTAFAVLVLYFFTARQNFTIQLQGSTEDHTRRTMYLTLSRIILNTPKLRVLIPEVNHHSYDITFPELGNRIQFSASNLASSFGDRLNLLWISDLHSFVDTGPYNAMQASLLDSAGSLQFIDANVDDAGGPVHSLQLQAEGDPGIFCRYVSYKDIDEYCERAPSWIDRAKARRLEKSLLPHEFARDILGQRAAAENALFPAGVIELCKSPYSCPVENLAALVQGRTYRIGGGLDRSKSLMGGLVARADNTIWTSVAKVAAPDGGEPEIFVLNQVNVVPNTAAHIKKVILGDHQRYGGFCNVTLEDYETVDILPWLLEQKITAETINAHSTRQNASFPELHRLAKEGRLHFPAELTGLADEMATFSYRAHKGQNGYSFGHAQQKFKDDRVFSLNWAVFSLRREVLSAYELGGIQCLNKTRRRPMCFLMGGALDFKDGCGRRCQAYGEVVDMHRQFLQFQTESNLSLAEFFAAYVRITGPVLYQNV